MWGFSSYYFLKYSFCLFLSSPLGLPVCVCVLVYLMVPTGFWGSVPFSSLWSFQSSGGHSVVSTFCLLCPGLKLVASAYISCYWVPLGFSYWLLSFSTSEFLFIISHSLLIFSIWWDLILKLSFSLLGIVSFAFASWTYWKSLSTKSCVCFLGDSFSLPPFSVNGSFFIVSLQDSYFFCCWKWVTWTL